MLWPIEVSSRVTEIAHTIQLALAPVFLLTGIGQVLNMLAGRLSRVVDRARAVEASFLPEIGPERARMVWELRLLDRRMKIINSALFLTTLSGVMICAVVALMFVADLANLRYGRWAAGFFIASMVLLICGLTMFLIEIQLALRAIRPRRDLLKP
ncbi:DUF2721 domain-containing protein [Sphingomonas sp. ID0503]|uniref:DUF2721 domain-containing protein n=1 Tax=Sphingomonas sp. ID0503 TaxID=3399691 RepID=UPI003AFADC80